MAFIDFLLDPAHETLNTLNIGFPNPNAMSFQWLPASFKQDQAVYPPEDVLAKLQFLRELSPEAEEAYTAIWDEVTAGT
jgi:spermidine/putrescine-binding protein